MKGAQEFNQRVFELFYLYNRRAFIFQDQFVSYLHNASQVDVVRCRRSADSSTGTSLFREIRQKERSLFHLYGRNGAYSGHAFSRLSDRLRLNRTEQRILVCLLGMELKNMVFRESICINSSFHESAANLVNLILPEPRAALGKIDPLSGCKKLMEQCIAPGMSFMRRGRVYDDLALRPELLRWLLGSTGEEPALAADSENEGDEKPPELLDVTASGPGLNGVVLSPENRKRIEQALYFHQSPEAQKMLSGVAGKFCASMLALFYGPPGTGKTLTANAIASELKKPLARVEYPSLFSMWFGQSDKKLRECFRASGSKGYVLLFDEADALITSRNQNTAVSHELMHRLKNIFLSEIERFNGVVILTTNMVETLDPALERRLNLKLELLMPGPREREALWGKMLKNAPLAEDVDRAALARNYPIAGGHIRNAVVSALRELMFLRRTQPVLLLTMQLLEKAAEKEITLLEFKSAKRAVGFGK